MGCFHANYPKKSKMCTDTSWLCLFIAFWVILLAITASAIVYGNYVPIINGYDSFGNICGVESNKRYENFSLSGTDTSTKPYVTFFANRNVLNAVKLCIEKCPTINVKVGIDLLLYSKKIGSQFCLYDFKMSYLKKNWENDYMSRLGPCPASKYRRSVPINHRCIPHSTELYTYLNKKSVPQQVLIHIYLAWRYISALSAFSVVLSIILLVMMHCLARIISWLICFLAIAANTGLCVLLWCVYGNVPIDKTDEYDSNEDRTFYYNIGEDFGTWYYLLKDFRANRNVIYVGIILTSVVTVALFMVIIALRQQITRLTLLLKEAGNCLAQLSGLVIIPLISLLIFFVYIAFSIYTMLCITTSSYLEVKPITYDSEITKYETRSFQQLEYTDLTFIRHSFYVYVVGFIWTIEFIFACEEFALGAVIAYRYFRRPVFSPIRYATVSLFRYHLGTVLKGSVAIALFKIPRLIVTCLSRKLRKVSCHSYSKRCNSIIGIIEEWLGVLNHNAYPVVAMETVDFIPAGAIAWNTIRKSAPEVQAISRAADFVLFLAKLLVATVTCIVAILLLRDREDLLFYMAPVLLSTVIAFFTAHIVFSLYEILIDTLLLCYCDEKAEHDRSMVRNLDKLFDRTGRANEGSIQFIKVTPINDSTFNTVNTK